MVVARLDLRLGKNVVVLGWTILAAGGQNAGGALLVEARSWLLKILYDDKVGAGETPRRRKCV